MLKHALLFAALALASPASADLRISYADGDRPLFSVAVPDFWSIETGGARAISPPGEEAALPVPQIVTLRPTVEPDVWMGFFSPPGISTLEGGLDYLSEIEKFMAAEPEITSISKGQVAGMAARIIKGTGRRDGSDIAYTIAVVDLPGARVAIAAAVAETTAAPALIDEINRVFASMRAGS
ncbi:hypothetical protein [Dinoroseobacter sp. S76]|uniref:hypothetical protein n=1 Tax=Dinoroseobacter sp. S76 TaxID=3415124 RepID=UPI003C7E9AFF